MRPFQAHCPVGQAAIIKHQNNNNNDFKLHAANKIILYYNT